MKFIETFSNIQYPAGYSAGMSSFWPGMGYKTMTELSNCPVLGQVWDMKQ